MKANSQTNQMLKDKIYKNIRSQRNDLKKIRVNLGKLIRHSVKITS